MHMIRTAKLAAALAAGVGICVFASPAKADWHGWHRGWHPGWHGWWGPPAVVVAPRPYYYAPPPVYYAPPPVVYAPAPAYYPPAVSLGVTVR